MRLWVFVLAVLLAGCGGEAELLGPTPAAPSTTGGDQAKRAAFLSAASLVKPGIAATKEDRVVSAGRNTCQALAGGTPRATVVAQGVERFSVNGQTVTAEESERLVSAAERTLC